MHEQITDSELFIIPNGTRYTTPKYPEIVNLKLEQFFRRRVFGSNRGSSIPSAATSKENEKTALPSTGRAVCC